MKARIISVANEDKGKYNQLTVNFRNLSTGKTLTTKVMSFTFPDVFAALKDAEVDSVYDVVVEKNDKDFWEWRKAVPATDAEIAYVPKAPPKANTAGRDFESKEERALRQVLIVRQSSVTAALTVAPQASLEDVLKLAEKVEQWVFRGKAAQKTLALGVKTIAEMDDDIPY